MSEITTAYLDNYQNLKDIAQDIDSSDVFDIDKVLPQIEEATKSYKFCLDRINKVKEALENIDSQVE